MAETLSIGFQPRDFELRQRYDEARLGNEGQYEWWGTELPPKEYWLINPYEQQLNVPTDERGLVVSKRVIELGRENVRKEYQWPTDKTRDDHMYWPETAYSQAARKLDDLLPHVFRNIPPNKVRLPLEFERWKHKLMIPADFPSVEAMKMSVEAWRSAEGLFSSIQDAVKLEKLRRGRKEGLERGTISVKPRFEDDRDSEDYFVDTLAAKFKGVALDLERHQKIPSEYRFIEIDDSVRDVVRKLSFLIKHGCRDGVTSRPLYFPPAVGPERAPAQKRNRAA